jgi:endonuclease YncB( thermonuclease family)
LGRNSLRRDFSALLVILLSEFEETMKARILVISVALLCVQVSPCVAQNIVGRPSIIDGDTIEIHGHRIRLWGIDAPESSQLCRNANSDLYRCGADAANKLASFIEAKVVSCESVNQDRYGRIVARCSVNGTDIAEWLVRLGLALDWPRYSHGRYGIAQKSASHAGQGIWAGTWTAPWEYRTCIRSGGRPAACSEGEG